jgi:hypothetical protein
MKLANDVLERVADQFDAEPLADTHPAVPQLSEIFGDHTFFVDGDGLHIIEPVEPAIEGDRVGNVVRVARWDDTSRNSLRLHEPEPSDVVIDLGRERPTDS